MVATSSTCSLMNHCMNCSEAKSLSSRAMRSRPLIWSVTGRVIRAAWAWWLSWTPFVPQSRSLAARITSTMPPMISVSP